MTRPRRSPAAPDIPTLSEAGLPGFEAVSWFALFAAPGTPKPVADKLSTQVAEVLKLPDVAKKLSDLGLEPVGSTPDELARYQQTEIAKWAKVVKESGATVESGAIAGAAFNAAVRSTPGRRRPTTGRRR